MTMRIETDLSCPLCANSAQQIIVLNALKVETIPKFKKAVRIRIEHTRTNKLKIAHKSISKQIWCW